jgi:hypothetical protein
MIPPFASWPPVFAPPLPTWQELEEGRKRDEFNALLRRLLDLMARPMVWRRPS